MKRHAPSEGRSQLANVQNASVPAVDQPWGNEAAAEDLGIGALTDLGTTLTASLPGMSPASAGAPSDPKKQAAISAQSALVRAAVNDALQMVDAAIQVLSAPSPATEPVIERWFATSDPARLRPALPALTAARAGLSAPFLVEVEPWSLYSVWDEDTRAYVVGSNSAIHLVPAFFQLSPKDQARTMLHEAMHNWGGISQDVYYLDGNESDLGVEDALANADSYARFAMDCLDHAVAARRAAEELAAEETAWEHIDAIWSSFLAGDPVLENGFQLEDGETVPASTLEGVLYTHFTANYPTEHADFLAAYSDGAVDGPLTCSTGYVIPPALFDLLYRRALVDHP